MNSALSPLQVNVSQVLVAATGERWTRCLVSCSLSISAARADVTRLLLHRQSADCVLFYLMTPLCGYSEAADDPGGGSSKRKCMCGWRIQRKMLLNVVQLL